MRLKSRQILIQCWLFSILIFVLPLKAQFYGVLQLEGGMARFKRQNLHLLARPKLQIGQNLKKQNISFKWSVLYQPEIFTLPGSTFSQRLNGQFALNSQFKNWFWGIHFRSRYQSFKIESQSYDWQSSDLVLNLNYWQKADFLWQGQIILWYRDTQQFDRQTLNSSIVRLGFGKFLPWITIYPNLYFEQYKIEPRYHQANNDRGQRKGLALRLEHNKKFLFSLDFKMLWHNKNGFTALKSEQQLDLLLAFWLRPKWALLIFAEYNNLASFSNANINVLSYQPINTTNHLQIKLSHDLAINSELFFRFGYEQENLIQPIEHWQYWQFVLGVNKSIRRVP